MGGCCQELQVKADIESEPLNSVAYSQAVEFLVGGGAWRDSRAAVADMLDVCAKHLSRLGHAWIAARQQREGLSLTDAISKEMPRPAAPSSQAALPYPPVPRQDNHSVGGRSAESRAQNRPRNWYKTAGMNPFNPFRHNTAFG